MRLACAGLACVLLASVVGPAADEPPLQNIDRRIAKEPEYTSKRPLYCLLAFGPAAQKGVWIVLDQSTPQSRRYDLMYVDLNANGDLTEPAERFAGKLEGNDIRFRLPDLKDPVTGAIHTRFTARVSNAPSPTIMVGFLWRGGLKMGGGYPQDPDNGYLKLGDKPANAPVMWANGESPFRFQHWCSGKLTIGAEDDFKVFIGQPGAGANSFWAFQEHFLPESEGVQATLIYRDAQKKEQRVVCLLKERC
jgi:hypothetical protein